MASGNSVNGILAGAKAAGQKAANFTKSVEGKNPSMFAPTRQFSKAPYSLVRKSGVDYNPIHVAKSVADTLEHPQGEDTAAGLSAVAKNVAEVTGPKK